MRVIVAAGGTGGHIYPALAIINRIQEQDKNSEVLYIGTTDRMEKDIVPAKGIRFVGIEIQGLNRKNPLANVKNLKKISAEFYSGLSASKESLFLQYKNSTAKENSLKKEQVKKDFKEALKNSREEDLALGFTTKGPHRDELEIRINEKSARQFSSQGQQRSAVLAIKLAETEIVRQTVGEDPIILLDDVLSELDAKRQSYLLKSIPQKQVFITCCEPELTSRLAAEKVFEVSDGTFL